MAAADTTILITGGRVYDHDGDTDRPATADILIEGTRIARIAPDLAGSLGAARPARVIDARDKLVLPGFVNAHYHSHDVLLKGCFETMPLEVWVLAALPHSYPKRSNEEVRARTLLGAAECLRYGITTVQDMLTLSPIDPEQVDVVLDAYDEIGIRAVFALQIGDLKGVDRVPFWRDCVPVEFHGLLAGAAEPGKLADPVTTVAEQYLRLREAKPRVRWALAPTSPEFCTPGFLERLGALAADHELPIYTHAYASKSMALAGRLFMPEHGGSQVAYLKELGLLGPRTSLVHSVWMRPDEVELIAQAEANVVLNPTGNLKVMDGIAPIREYLAAGAGIGLGCDNSSCGGARTAGLGGEIGALKPGMKADLSILDLHAPSFVPLNSAARQLVYAENGASVETVLVDGTVVMEERQLLTISESELRDAVAAVMPRLREDFAAVSTRIDTLRPYLMAAWRRSWEQDVGLDRHVARFGP